MKFAHWWWFAITIYLGTIAFIIGYEIGTRIG